jgi:hypothetical protein
MILANTSERCGSFVTTWYPRIFYRKVVLPSLCNACHNSLKDIASWQTPDVRKTHACTTDNIRILKPTNLTKFCTVITISSDGFLEIRFSLWKAQIKIFKKTINNPLTQYVFGRISTATCSVYIKSHLLAVVPRKKSIGLRLQNVVKDLGL